VHDASAPEETKNDSSIEKSTATSNPKIKHCAISNSKQNKPHGGKGQPKQRMPKAERTQEELKIEVGYQCFVLDSTYEYYEKPQP
jgi:hypothetical protein